ncbi:MAG: hypothetical protein GX366_06160 [Epulopiscium sp.]|nr:hypothetical protein [Candidatus Epulonipiscium sp.]
MDKKIIATFGVLAITIAIAISNIGVVKAEESQPGGSTDPVVTKSYVDREIAKAKANGEMVDLLNKEVNDLKREISRLKVDGAGNDIYEVVYVEPGQKLIGGQGTEIILRAGQGTAVVAERGGLQDVTEGVDISQGFIPKYHLLITPRDDGRGVLVTKRATFMVRGEYSIK